ncbi:ring-hydroxylating oxygenase subunit alpha [Maritimibacter sp. 55A14]|uniref:aromatic ring-hydroxylating oxygenase subunit alpha n=1 Tax=Maritimibacter sp. 55A14 TaxID=2174844 RepID=UPI000D61B4CC|nr:aromatic ring-hydroxylating dioxygenase subunit alpha [Maritimibacter sp. 55A14]PWE34246.1 ring-hydroxylating oxygenase subunit alpha [Maritimibacter sp. 55A14]
MSGAASPPVNWDRSGLPGWTYSSRELFDLELATLFRTHWQLAGHVSDLPEPGDYICFDIGHERAVVIRGQDGRLRAFHNLCRHRGTRVVADRRGHCNKAMICPFHGWAYNFDGTLRGVAEADTFPDLDRVAWGLKPVELEVWLGFVFIRFVASGQPPVAELLARYEAEAAAYGAADVVPTGDGFWTDEIAVNWKAVRDVDNEGYHVRQAHPALHDLYGTAYHDEPFERGAARSEGRFNDGPSRLWSVRAYRSIIGDTSPLAPAQRGAWVYIALFPNTVIGLYPDSVTYYQEIPLDAERTLQRGAVYRHRDESRALRLARYLSGRIDRDTLEEDQMLCVWSAEATKSSAYDGVILSDLEYGLKTFHDHLREKVPVVCLPEEPGAEDMRQQLAAVDRG